MKTLSMLKKLPSNAVCNEVTSPIGNLILIVTSKHVLALIWSKSITQESSKIIESLPRITNNKIIKETQKQLKEYFSCKRKKFDLPLYLDGTDFQKESWKRLKKIPYAKTISYQEQAISLGDANKVRAVGSANGRNPISIIVPCHRVIAKNGSLGGYAGGINVKNYLLTLEQNNS